jgi:thioredoxin-dependent peroxiredoxin
MSRLSYQLSLRTAALLAAVLAAVPVRAQQPAPAPAPVITVGSVAPDFALRGATRYGLLANPVRLSDYRGQTVVIAFFYKARTKG